MHARITTLSAAVLLSALAVGCQHDGGSMNNDSTPSSSAGSMSGSSSSGKPLEGNPGATTNQSAGYPQSDPGAYHPQTDDTKQYHPANTGSVQPSR